MVAEPETVKLHSIALLSGIKLDDRGLAKQVGVEVSRMATKNSEWFLQAMRDDRGDYAANAGWRLRF